MPDLEFVLSEEPPSPERLFAFYEVVKCREFRPLGDAVPRDAEIICADSRWRHLCAYDGDEFVGWSYLKPIEPGYLDLGIVVHPDYRGQGIGSAMLDRLLEMADLPIKLSAVADNTMPIAWYERNGFRLLGTYQTQTAECVRMVRE